MRHENFAIAISVILIETDERKGNNMATVTISTHNGSAAHRDHNIRNRKVTDKESHIDPNGIHEIWKDEKPRDAYERIFGEAVKKYNEKQSREYRRIDNYYDHVSKDAKKHPVYEMIVGVYGEVDEKIGKEILKEFAQGWEKRNPNLELIGCYYHADERGEPHIHMDYVPVAHGYKNGMETQNGLDRALKEQGFQTKGIGNTAQIQWEKSENNTLDALCRARGLEVSHPRIEGRKHLETGLYEAQRALERAIDNTKELLDSQDDLRVETARLEKQRDHANRQLQKSLERRAGLVKRSFKKEKENRGWTYDKGTMNELKEIARGIREDVKAISHTDQEVVAKFKEAEQERESARWIKESAQREAEATLREAQQIRDRAEQIINQRAQAIANQQLQEIMERMYGRNGKGREGEMERFLEKYQVQGKSLLQIFNEEQERKLQKARQSWRGR